MPFVAAIDVNTLLGCQIALAAIYALVFFCMKRIYPHLRGAGSVSIAFLVATFGNVLLVLSGSVPTFVSIAVSHCLLLSAFVLFYTGILHFFNSPRKIHYAWVLTVITTGWIVYLVLSHDRTTALTYVIAISFFCVRGLIAVEVFRQAADRIFLKIFAFLMAFYAVFALNRVIFLGIFGVPPTQAQREILQVISVVLSVSFTFLIGMSFLLMLCSDLLTLVRDESVRDLLCGVFNRRGIQLKLEAELKRTGRIGQSLSVALVDVDHFKNINDEAGHAAGDTALRNVASTLSERLRPHDLIGRFGGDEFLVVFPHTTAPDALKVCSRIQQSIRELSIPSTGLPLTISIGLTQAAHNELPDPFLARADKALYNAKNDGRNCCRVLLHEPEPAKTIERLVLPLEP
jgi:diguanylate cyclase (GGDEF)-like protein